MKFKNLHEETITIATKNGNLVARHGEFIELDEATYDKIKTIYTKLQMVEDKPVVVNEPAEKPKTKANKKCK